MKYLTLLVEFFKQKQSEQEQKLHERFSALERTLSESGFGVQIREATRDSVEVGDLVVLHRSECTLQAVERKRGDYVFTVEGYSERYGCAVILKADGTLLLGKEFYVPCSSQKQLEGKRYNGE